MNHVRPLSRAPAHAESSIPIDAKIQYAEDIIVNILIPVMTNKNPSNPGEPPTTTTTTES